MIPVLFDGAEPVALHDEAANDVPETEKPVADSEMPETCVNARFVLPSMHWLPIASPSASSPVAVTAPDVTAICMLASTPKVVT